MKDLDHLAILIVFAIFLLTAEISSLTRHYRCLSHWAGLRHF